MSRSPSLGGFLSADAATKTAAAGCYAICPSNLVAFSAVRSFCSRLGDFLVLIFLGARAGTRSATATDDHTVALAENKIIAAQWMTLIAVGLVAIAVAPIIAIFFVSDPGAIAFPIAAIIVNSIKRFAWGSLTHINYETFKVAPSLAHGDAAAPIIGKPWMIWVSAPLNHVRPSAVSRRLPANAGMSMNYAHHMPPME